MVTLIFCVLLKMDRDSLEEDLPGGLDFFGSALIFVNSIVPGAALTVGVLLYGLEGIETEVYKADTKLHAFDNPLTVDEPLDDRESEAFYSLRNDDNRGEERKAAEMAGLAW
jgi:hypothetical protein